jgi:hypothetical protein
VPGKRIEIGSQSPDIHGHVGGRLGPIHHHQGPHGPGRLGDLGHRVNGAQHIGDVHHAHQPDPLGQEGAEVLQLQAPIIPKRYGFDPGPRALADQVPGHQVGVVLHLGQENFVAGPQVAQPPGIGHQVEGLGGVAHEDNLALLGPNKAGQGAAGLLVGLAGLRREGVGPPVHAGVEFPVVAGYRLDDRFGLLAGGRRVEVDQLGMVHEQWKVLAKGLRRNDSHVIRVAHWRLKV